MNPVLKSLLQEKIAAQKALDDHFNTKPPSTDLEATIAYDIEHKKLMLISVDADTAYDKAIKVAAA